MAPIISFCNRFLAFAGAKVGIFIKLTKFFVKKIVIIRILCNFALEFERKSANSAGSSAVGSALRSVRRGRAFESPLPDERRQSVNIGCRFVVPIHYFQVPQPLRILTRATGMVHVHGQKAVIHAATVLLPTNCQPNTQMANLTT